MEYQDPINMDKMLGSMYKTSQLKVQYLFWASKTILLRSAPMRHCRQARTADGSCATGLRS